jgi:HEAT repeat protein
MIGCVRTLIQDKKSSLAIKKAAIRYLGNLRSARSLEILLKNFKALSDNRLKAEFLRAIGKTNTQKGFKCLVPALQDDDWNVRLEALKAVSNAIDPERLKYLANGLNDTSWWVRLAAGGGLLQSGEEGQKIVEGRSHEDSPEGRFCRILHQEWLGQV